MKVHVVGQRQAELRLCRGETGRAESLGGTCVGAEGDGTKQV